MKFKLLGAGALFVGFSMSAMAYPNLETITGIAGTSNYTDTGAEAVYLTDTSGVNDDITAFLLFEFAGFRDNNSFGIYDFSRGSDGILSVGDTLELFAGSVSPEDGGSFPANTTVQFDLSNGTAEANGTTKNIGKTFGFYLDNPVNNGGFTWYSHQELNSDGEKHALIFNTSDNTNPKLGGSDVVVAFEDLCATCSPDWDYNDMVVGVTDVLPVPEPGTLALLGLGLAGLGAARRRQKVA